MKGHPHKSRKNSEYPFTEADQHLWDKLNKIDSRLETLLHTSGDVEKKRNDIVIALDSEDPIQPLRKQTLVAELARLEAEQLAIRKETATLDQKRRKTHKFLLIISHDKLLQEITQESKLDKLDRELMRSTITVIDKRLSVEPQSVSLAEAEGFLPIHSAVAAYNPDALVKLLMWSTDDTIIGSKNSIGNTAQQMAIRNLEDLRSKKNKNSSELIELAEECVKHLSLVLDEKYTSLHLAAYHNNVFHVRRLLRKCEDRGHRLLWQAETKDGFTAEDLVLKKLKEDATPDVRKKQEKCLELIHLASKSRYNPLHIAVYIASHNLAWSRSADEVDSYGISHDDLIAFMLDEDLEHIKDLLFHTQTDLLYLRNVDGFTPHQLAESPTWDDGDRHEGVIELLKCYEEEWNSWGYSNKDAARLVGLQQGQAVGGSLRWESAPDLVKAEEIDWVRVLESMKFLLTACDSKDTMNYLGWCCMSPRMEDRLIFWPKKWGRTPHEIEEHESELVHFMRAKYKFRILRILGHCDALVKYNGSKDLGITQSDFFDSLKIHAKGLLERVPFDFEERDNSLYPVINWMPWCDPKSNDNSNPTAAKHNGLLTSKARNQRVLHYTKCRVTQPVPLTLLEQCDEIFETGMLEFSPQMIRLEGAARIDFQRSLVERYLQDWYGHTDTNWFKSQEWKQWIDQCLARRLRNEVSMDRGALLDWLDNDHDKARTVHEKFVAAFKMSGENYIDFKNMILKGTLPTEDTGIGALDDQEHEMRYVPRKAVYDRNKAWITRKLKSLRSKYSTQSLFEAPLKQTQQRGRNNDTIQNRDTSRTTYGVGGNRPHQGDCIPWLNRIPEIDEWLHEESKFAEQHILTCTFPSINGQGGIGEFGIHDKTCFFTPAPLKNGAIYKSVVAPDSLKCIGGTGTGFSVRFDVIGDTQIVNVRIVDFGAGYTAGDVLSIPSNLNPDLSSVPPWELPPPAKEAEITFVPIADQVRLMALCFVSHFIDIYCLRNDLKMRNSFEKKKQLDRIRQIPGGRNDCPCRMCKEPREENRFIVQDRIRPKEIVRMRQKVIDYAHQNKFFERTKNEIESRGTSTQHHVGRVVDTVRMGVRAFDGCHQYSNPTDMTQHEKFLKIVENTKHSGAKWQMFSVKRFKYVSEASSTRQVIANVQYAPQDPPDQRPNSVPEKLTYRSMTRHQYFIKAILDACDHNEIILKESNFVTDQNGFVKVVFDPMTPPRSEQEALERRVIQIACKLLHHEKFQSSQVKIMMEIQLYFEEFWEIRKMTHMLYKIVRQSDLSSLANDCVEHRKRWGLRETAAKKKWELAGQAILKVPSCLQEASTRLSTKELLAVANVLSTLKSVFLIRSIN